MKICRKAYLKQWKLDNADREKSNNKQWKTDNLDKERLSQSIWRNNNQDYYLQWKIDNRSQRNAIQAKYRAKKLLATPKWLNKSHLEEIAEFYKLAQELAWLNHDGRPFDVDHIVPLQGEKVSGLHVPWNLQLLPHSLNCSKKNK